MNDENLKAPQREKPKSDRPRKESGVRPEILELARLLAKAAVKNMERK